MFFEEPQPFDLVMLLTGAGAVPYLREGPIATPRRWGEITQAFEDNFCLRLLVQLSRLTPTHSGSVSV
jgi:hypothetical protein